MIFKPEQGATTPFTAGVHILDLISRFSLVAGGASLLLIILSYCYEVAARYFFNAPTSWSNDYIQLFLPAMIMLALPELTKNNGHIVISFFLEKLPDDKRILWGRILAIIGALTCMVTAAVCFRESYRQYTMNIETLWNNPIPKWVISGWMPYGFAFAGLQFFRTAFKRNIPNG